MIFLMPIYFIIALLIIRLVMKRYPTKYKWLQFLALAFLLYLPVGWDVMLGRAYWQYLCHKDGGIHIYQTVKLGPEHWTDDGYPLFYDEKGNFDEGYFGGTYSQVSTFPDKSLQSFLPISRDLLQIVNTETNEVLGERVRG